MAAEYREHLIALEPNRLSRAVSSMMRNREKKYFPTVGEIIACYYEQIGDGARSVPLPEPPLTAEEREYQRLTTRYAVECARKRRQWSEEEQLNFLLAAGWNRERIERVAGTVKRKVG